MMKVMLQKDLLGHDVDIKKRNKSLASSRSNSVDLLGKSLGLVTQRGVVGLTTRLISVE